MTDASELTDQEIADALTGIDEGLSDWAMGFAESIAERVERGRGLTGRQRQTALKILVEQGVLETDRAPGALSETAPRPDARLVRALRRLGGLTTWEYDFFISLDKRIATGRALTERQRGQARRILDEHGVDVARVEAVPTDDEAPATGALRADGAWRRPAPSPRLTRIVVTEGEHGPIDIDGLPEDAPSLVLPLDAVAAGRALEESLAALERGDEEDALRALVRAWTDCSAGPLVQAIDRLGARVTRSQPPIAGATVTARHEALRAQRSRYDAVRFGRLVELRDEGTRSQRIQKANWFRNLARRDPRAAAPDASRWTVAPHQLPPELRPTLDAIVAWIDAAEAPPGGTPASLLARVLDEPGDAGARAVYADALLERDAADDRGLLITLQSRIADGQATDDDRARADEILGRRAREWLGPVARALESWTFERGFPATGVFRSGAAALDARGAREWVTFHALGLGRWHRAQPRLLPLIDGDAPAVRSLTGLSAPTVVALDDWPALAGRLTSLRWNLRADEWDEGRHALAAGAALTGLRELTIDGTDGGLRSGAFVRWLGDAGVVDRLDALTLVTALPEAIRLFTTLDRRWAERPSARALVVVGRPWRLTAARAGARWSLHATTVKRARRPAGWAEALAAVLTTIGELAADRVASVVVEAPKGRPGKQVRAALGALPAAYPDAEVVLP